MAAQKEKQTVLVVDDEPLIRLHLKQVIEEVGHEAKEASTAAAALEQIEDDGITMLLTDIDMPGKMDGLELAREVKAKWPHISIVVSSGRYLPHPTEMPGETLFLSKPFSEERLIDILRLARSS